MRGLSAGAAILSAVPAVSACSAEEDARGAVLEAPIDYTQTVGGVGDSETPDAVAWLSSDERRLRIDLGGDISCPPMPVRAESNASTTLIVTFDFSDEAKREGCLWTGGRIETTIDVSGLVIPDLDPLTVEIRYVGVDEHSSTTVIRG